MNDSPQEMACLDRAELWESLIGFAEEIERAEIEAEVGRHDRDPTRLQASTDPQSGAPSLKRPKFGKFKPGWYDPKTMTRAVARDLGLI